MHRPILRCIPLVLTWAPGVLAQVSPAPWSAGPNHGIEPTPPGGTLVAVNTDTLVLRPEHRVDTLRIPVTWVSGLEMSRGRRSRIGAGTGYGALAGGLAGALVRAVACSQSTCANGHQEEGNQTALFALRGAAVGVAVGAIVGAVIGAGNSAEQWADAVATLAIERRSATPWGCRPRGVGPALRTATGPPDRRFSRPPHHLTAGVSDCRSVRPPSCCGRQRAHRRSISGSAAWST
jgi:hypothetical protein